ncbi:MAG: hypothetical protein AAF483_29165, partial [Planctomycetota bacterium]
MIVNGIFTSFYGIYTIVLSFFWPDMMANNPAFQDGTPEAKMAMEFMPIAFIATGVLCIILALLYVFSGILLIKFRGYKFAFVALIGGMASLMTCYCFPTSLGLLIFGLIVLLDQPVRDAFEAAEAGVSPKDIISRHNAVPRR